MSDPLAARRGRMVALSVTMLLTVQRKVTLDRESLLGPSLVAGSGKGFSRRKGARKDSRTSICLRLCVVLLIGRVSLSHAAGVLPMDVSTLAEFAGQVVAGTIHSAVPQWAENPRRIETTVTLQDIEYLKGMPSAASRAFTFVVPGGTVDGIRMHIGGAPTFQVGERWLLFLLPTYKIFPVVGIHRGCFRVQQASDGIERMYDVSHKPILGLDRNNRIIAAATASSPNRGLVREAGARILATDASRRGEPAIRYDDFRRLLRPILDQSKDHQLTQQAGRRLVHHWKATTLKPAAEGRNAAEFAVNRRSVLPSSDTPERTAPRGRAPRRH